MGGHPGTYISTGTIPVTKISSHHFIVVLVDRLTVTASDDAVRVMIVATSIGTRAHGDDPSYL